MSSEHLASAQNELKGNLGGAWNILDGAQGQYQDLGVARRFGGSSAAYSLRDIGAMNGPVVNVRREPHDTSAGIDDEINFSANQISSGALEDWVNGKLETTLPADVATAAAAYSLRKVKASYSGDAVRIRRSSDDIEVDVAFDSDDKVSASSAITNIAEQGGEIGSTTATDLNGFLNETLTVGTAVNGTSPYGNYDFEANSNTGFDADNSAGGTGSAGFPYSFASGDVMIIRYTVSNFDSTSSLSPAVRGTTGTNSVVAAAGGGTTFTANGTYTDTLTATADGTHLMFADGNTGSYTISDFQIVSHTHQAFVHTWYDQAGSNDATQATAGSQPKIAESGALLDGIKFSSASDGTSANHLDIAAKLMDSTDGFMSSVINSVQDMNQLGVIYGNRNNNSGFVFGIHQAEYPQVFYRQSSGANRLENSNFILSSSRKYLLSVDKDGTNDANLFGNAVSKDTDSSMNYITSTGSASKIGQGGNTVTSDANGLNANINELIFYNSDQAANRFKIESNINNYYGLYNDANDLTQTEWQATGVEGDFVSTSTDGFSYQNSSSTSFVGVTLKDTLAFGDSVFVSFNASGVTHPDSSDQSPQIRLRDAVGGGDGASDIIQVTNGFNAHTLTYSVSGKSNGDNIVFSEGDTAGGTVTISDFKVSRIARNGFVETWYDQSGNGFDLKSQSADTQPFIVNNGGFTGGVYSPSRLNNSTKQYLEISDPKFDSTNITSSKFGWLAVMANMEENDGTNAGGVILGNTRNTQTFPAGSISLTLSDTNPNGRMFVTNLKTGSTGDFIGAVDNDALFTSETIGTAVVDGSSLSTFLNGTTGSGTFTGLTLTSDVPFRIFQSSENATTVYYQNAAQGFIKELMFMQGDTIDDIVTIRNEVNNHYNIF